MKLPKIKSNHKILPTLLFLVLCLSTQNIIHAQDRDGDGIADAVDLDDDNDGILDVDEGYVPGSFGTAITLDQFSAIPNGTYIGDPAGMRLSDVSGNYILDIFPATDFAGAKGSTHVSFNTTTGLIETPSFATAIRSNEHIELRFTTANSPTPWLFKDLTIFDINSLSNPPGLVRDAYAWDKYGTWTPTGSPQGAIYEVDYNAANGLGALAHADPDGPETEALNFSEELIPLSLGQSLSQVLLNSQGESDGHELDFNFDIANAEATLFIFDALDNSVHPNSRLFWEFNARMQVTPILPEQTIDSDNDNIPDHLDTDSDNDGCPDALEGGDNKAWSAIDADLMLTAAVDTDPASATYGVPGSTSQTLGTSIDDTQQSALCNECLETTHPDFVDNDGDGIGNQCDLDDDNDGILDSNECLDTASLDISGMPSPNPGNTGNAELGNNGTATAEVGDIYTYTSAMTLHGVVYDVQIEFISINTVSSATRISFLNSGQINIQGFQTTDDDHFIIEYKILNQATGLEANFDGISLITKDIDGLNGRSEIAGFLNSEFSSISLTGLGPNPLEELGFANGSPSGGFTTIRQASGTEIDNTLTTHDITVQYNNRASFQHLFGMSNTVPNPPGAGGRNFSVEISVMDACDTDGDGTPNYLDNDSDNDGCPDSIEGAGAFTTEDLDGDDSLGDVVDTDASSSTYGVPIVGGSVATQNTTTGVTKPVQASIGTNPSNTTTFGGDNASFTVAASAQSTATYSGTAPNTTPDYSTSPSDESSGLRYQWQEDSGSGFADIVNGGIYSGATTATLTLTAVTTANNGFVYKVIVTHIDNDCIAEEASATLTVENKIIANNDDFSATPVNGTSGGSTVTVFTDDTLDGNPFANSAVLPTITDNDGLTGLTLNADGTLSIPANTVAGAYTITYQICEAANTDNCDTATVVLDVVNEIIANDDDFSATPVNGTNGGNTATVFTDDTLSGVAFANAAVLATITDNDGIAGLTVNTDGTLSIPANTDAGTYSITYQICEAANTDNCDTAEVDLEIVNEIVANNDDFSATPIDGTAGGTTATVFTDDTLDGNSFANGAVNPTITNNDGITGLTINADGTLSIPANTDAGTYSVTYQICEATNTDNCDTATVAIVVENKIVANDDDFSATPINGVSGGNTPTVFTDDTLDGATFTNADVDPTITDNDGLTGLTINADGTLTVPAGTATGTYEVTYQICEAANTTNCDTAVVEIAILPDSDNDGVPDAVDLDDDNDGILDSVECSIKTDSSAPKTSEGYQYISPARMGVTAAISNDANLSMDVSSVFGLPIGSIIVSMEGANTSPSGGLFSAAINRPNKITISGTTPVYATLLHGATLNTLNSRDGIIANDGAHYNMFTPVETGYVHEKNGSDYYFEMVNTSADGNHELMQWSSSEPVTDIEVYTTRSSNFQNNFRLYLKPFCDSDNDGIADHLDLDSDNDGIYDVIESGGTDANNDGRADDDDNNTDNSASNGIPTTAGTGVTNPTDTGNNNSPDYSNSDSDGDGCPDAIEAGFADDNQDGFLGDAPLTVDANGLVTSATGYADPTETTSGTADYTDKNVNSCAGISITKTATLIDVNSNGIDDAGDRIDYTFVVTNTGTVDLTDVKVTDVLATVTPTTTISLAAGASDNSTYTATYTIDQDDINAGNFTNTAIAEGKDPGGTTISDTSDDPTNATNVDPNTDGEPDDPTVVDFTQEPSISLLKTGELEDANNDGFPNKDEEIRYSFTVQNTGNVTLTGITINDPLVTVLGGPINLAPGEMNTTTFYALYKLTQANIDSGSITNAAVVTGKDPNDADVTDNSDDPTNSTDVDDNADGDPDDDTVITLLKNAKIEIFKTGAFVDTNTDGIGQLGETVDYIFDVRNVGNVTLTGVTINDPKVTVTGGPITLIPGELDNTTFEASYPLVQADIDAGEVINRATVTSKDPDNVDVEDMSDDPTTSAPEDETVVTLANDPKIALFKTSTFNDENGDGFANVGETITYHFDVRNVGNVTLNDVQITDPKVTVTGGSISLAPATFDDSTFEAIYTLTQDDVENGTIENQAEVTSEDSTGNVVEDVSDFSDDPTNPANVDLNMDGDPDDPTVTDLPSNPSISLEKVGVFNDENNDGLAQVNETMSYTFRVQNTGNLKINNVLITDPIVTVSGGPITVMNPGDIDTATFTATYALTQADIDAGEVSNLATVVGQNGNGDDITDDSDDPNEPLNTDNNNDGEPDDPTVLVTPQESSISLTKSADPGSFSEVGDSITYNMVITNTGNTTLSNIVVTDNNATIVSGSPVASLAPGATSDVVATYTITQTDFNSEIFTNVAMVSANDPNDDTITDLSDDPNNNTDVDPNSDGEPDDPTVIELDSDGDGLKNSEDLDDDNDGITDIEEQNGQPFLDTDNDGVLDRLDTDADGDGILDVIEAGHGIADTDGDGRLDGPVGTDGIPDSVQNDPNGGMVTYTPRDTDGDGIHDFQDIDDDGDGVLTSQETVDGTNPLEECNLLYGNISLVPEASWNNLDCDGDGVINGTEIANGTDPTNPCDFVETSITEPLNANFNTADCDGDGVTNEQEEIDGTDPEDPCDFVLENASLLPNQAWNDSDCDGDGVTNEQELMDGTDSQEPCDYILANATIAPSAAWNDADCDGDLISNGQEVLDGTDPNNDCSSVDGTPLSTSDCDNDGLNTQEEQILGTDPENPDTDGDSIPDGQEVTDNTNALDPCDSIGGTPPAGSSCGIEVMNELMTPDGDGINDTFRIRNIENYPDNSVEIFNRWGVKVFSAQGYDNESNAFIGISNGRVTIKASETLPPGVYFYVINYNDNEETLSKSGYLYINQ